MSNRFGKVWFHALDCETVGAWLHESLVHYVHEYHWKRIIHGHSTLGDGPHCHGWFRPNNVHTIDLFAALPGVTVLPDLADPSPLHDDHVTLLSYAKVTKGDTPFSAVRKIYQYHKDEHLSDYPEMRPSYY